MVSYYFLLAMPLILILFYFFQSKYAKKLHPPGPPGLPFIGNLHQFDGRHTYLHRLSKQYGPIVSLKLGFRRVVVISSADAVKEIMKSHDAVFSSRPGLVSMKRVSYNGLDVAFAPSGDVWKEMRKISMTHLFSMKKLESFRPIFKEEVSKLIERIARDASSSTVTDLSEATMSYSSKIICRAAFGKNILEEEGGKKRYFNLLHEIQPVMAGFYVEDYFPSFGWIDRLSGMTAKLEKTFRELDCFYEELIQEHMDPNRPSSMEGDLIDTMLGIIRNGSSSLDLKLDHIKALIMNIITGGSETSAAVLVWAMTALMKKPLVMEKVQTEIRELGGNKEIMDEEDIQKLPYFRAMVKETFRLFPPGPLLIPRETTTKCSLNGYEIEAGSMAYINAWAIGRDPAAWENADEFVPERFLNTGLDLRGKNPEVIPFGIGRRGCPGIGMGMAETELALVNILYKFHWELPPGMKARDIDLDFLPGLAVHKKNALSLLAKLK